MTARGWGAIKEKVFVRIPRRVDDETTTSTTAKVALKPSGLMLL